MEQVGAVLQFILDMGPSIVLPIIIIIMGLAFRIPFSKILRAAIIIGIGFIAINLVIGLLIESIGIAARSMTERWGISLSVLDVGWPVTAAISFGSPFVFGVIIMTIIINLIMLFFKMTKVLYIDLWNYWHFIFTGALVYYATKNVYFAYLAAGLTAIIIFKLADIYAKPMQEFTEIEGVTLPHTETISWSFVCFGLNKLIDYIPVINKIQWTDDVLRKKLNIMGEPMIMGVVLGAFIGVLAGYNVQKTLDLAMKTGAVLLLMPRMIRLLMEGLTVIADGVRDFLVKNMPGREILLGLDAAIAVGHPMVVTCSLIMIPITILLAVILPGNRVLPFADLGIVPFFCLWPMIAARKNLFRGILIATVNIIMILYITTWLAPVTTTMAQAANFTMPANASEISSLDVGAHLVPFLIYKVLALFGS